MQILEPFPKSTSSGSEAGTIALQKPFKVTLQQAQGQELLPNAITNMLCGRYKLQGTLEYIQNGFFFGHQFYSKGALCEAGRRKCHSLGGSVFFFFIVIFKAVFERRKE
jgi:hypothetical protein